jgi:hypothetical protein
MRSWRHGLVWAFAFFCLGTSAALANDGRWRRAESEHFVIYSDGSESGLREATQTLEDFHIALETLTNSAGTEDSTFKLEIYLLEDSASLRVVSPDVSQYVGGFYSTSTEHMAAFLVYNNNYSVDAREVLQHEYAHHFMLHRFPAAYPRWYTEGWAEFVSTTEVRDRRAVVGVPGERINRLYAANAPSTATRAVRGSFSVTVLPIEQLLAPERYPNRHVDPDFVGHFYATAWLATSLIANRPELSQGLTAYVRALGEGGDPIESFEPAFGMTPAAFEDAMTAYVRGSARAIGVPLPAATAAVQITRLPESMDDLLLRVARMKLRIDLDHNPEQLAETVNRAATRYPTDPFVQRAAARVALLSNDTARARTLLEPIIAANNTDAEALLLMGLSYSTDAAREGQTPEAATEAIRIARRHWAAGFRANPDYFPILFLYAQSFRSGTAPLAPAQLDVMARALYLAPQADDIRFAYAEAALDGGRYEEAADTLRPLLHSPHDEDSQTRARTMFEEARRPRN